MKKKMKKQTGKKLVFIIIVCVLIVIGGYILTVHNQLQLSSLNPEINSIGSIRQDDSRLLENKDAEENIHTLYTPVLKSH